MYSHARLEQLSLARRPVALCHKGAAGGRASVARLDYASVMGSEEGVRVWLEVLARDGLCIIADVPTRDEEVRRVAERCGPVMNTIYGLQWDVKVEPNPINIAYSPVGLDLHQDLAYYESPPGIQASTHTHARARAHTHTHQDLA